jgi:hypothetical protein
MPTLMLEIANKKSQLMRAAGLNSGDRDSVTFYCKLFWSWQISHAFHVMIAGGNA